MGLILIIPIVGQIILLGWLLATLDNLRAGHHEMPPAGFSYFGRGVRLFVVLLLYGLVPPALFGTLLWLAIAIGIPEGGIFVLAFGYAVLVVGELVLALLPPWLIVATERGGILGGLNLPAVVARAMRGGEQSVIIALFALVANVIGSLGAVACLVGAYFTTPYGYAILAAVTLHYERSIAGAGAPGVVA
jgi:Protein of unknown function (DUF4013)